MTRRSVVFYDTEFTTWPGAMENGWREPGQYREIAQIGAVRFNLDTMREEDEFDILVKPVKNPVVSDFFTELTGIAQKDIDEKGVSFPDAYRLFTAFIGADKTCCYGRDADVMRENLGWNGMPHAPENFDSLDIGPWFKCEGKPFGVQEKTNSGRLAAALGAPMSAIQEHNALHDARSIAAAYRFLKGKGVKDFFRSLVVVHP
ncbi:MAG: exonuclease domain-containing protein [Alphaproteobacteria bacterium]|nr:exonuclease domain-containing protein [Alphaproteobacteria bacterium]